MSRRRGRRQIFEEEESDEDMPGPSTGRSMLGRNTQRNETTSQVSQATNSRASQRPSNAGPSQSSSTIRPSQGISKKRTTRPSTTRDETPFDPFDTFDTLGTQKGASNLPEEEEKSLIASVIRYLLIADRPKNMIQRVNIIKAALPNHSKHYRHIMACAQPIMREIFGYNLVDLEGGKYLLTNNLENAGPHIHFSKSERSEQVLLFIALTHIFMSEQHGCEEDDLLELFRALNIIEDDNFHHEYFGDIKYLLTDKFVKQSYLDHVIVDRTDPPTKHYQWGARADKELSPRHVLEFMSKIFGGRALNTWPMQFNIMQSRENLNINAPH